MTAPTPGQKWNLSLVASKTELLSTLFGTVGPQNSPFTPAMSAHIYKLKENVEDKQGPHKEEELYYVLSGSRTLLIGEESSDEVQTELSKGDMVYVPANVTHRFIGTDEIVLLVFFAPNFTG